MTCVTICDLAFRKRKYPLQLASGYSTCYGLYSPPN